jgi:hypothetical protein
MGFILMQRRSGGSVILFFKKAKGAGGPTLSNFQMRFSRRTARGWVKIKKKGNIFPKGEVKKTCSGNRTGPRGMIYGQSYHIFKWTTVSEVTL